MTRKDLIVIGCMYEHVVRLNCAKFSVFLSNCSWRYGIVDCRWDRSDGRYWHQCTAGVRHEVSLFFHVHFAVTVLSCLQFCSFEFGAPNPAWVRTPQNCGVLLSGDAWLEMSTKPCGPAKHRIGRSVRSATTLGKSAQAVLVFVLVIIFHGRNWPMPRNFDFLVGLHRIWFFPNPTGAGFGIADLAGAGAGAGAECSWAGGLGYIT